MMGGVHPVVSRWGDGRAEPPVPLITHRIVPPEALPAVVQGEVGPRLHHRLLGRGKAGGGSELAIEVRRTDDAETRDREPEQGIRLDQQLLLVPRIPGPQGLDGRQQSQQAMEMVPPDRRHGFGRREGMAADAFEGRWN